MNRREGFTIIEVAIVVIVLGILSAVTVVSYSAFQNRARASAATAALSRANKKLEIYESNNGSYPAAGDLAAADIVNSQDVTYQYSLTASGYCMTATAGTVVYKITESGTSSEGACSGHSAPGVLPITNILTNPSLEGGLVNGNLLYYNAPSILDTSTYFAGASSVKTTTNSSVNAQGYIWLGPATPGTYTCSVYLKSSTNTAVRVGGRSLNSTGAKIAEAQGVKTVTLTNNWQRVSITYTENNVNLAKLGIQYRLDVAQSGAIIWGDAAMCTTGTTLYGYADGDTANWIWNGAANNATSTGPPL